DPFKPQSYSDEGAGQAIEGLKNSAALRDLEGHGGKIRGGDLVNAPGARPATASDNTHAAGLEHDDFSKFATENRDKLDPSAQRVMDVYDKFARQAHAEGRTGLTQQEHDQMMKEMAQASKPQLGDIWKNIGNIADLLNDVIDKM